MAIGGRGRREVLVGPRPGAQPRPWRRWLRRGLIAAACLALAIAALVYDAHLTDARLARLQMEQVASAALRFRQDFDRCPRGVEELATPPAGARPYLPRTPRDPWGRPYFVGCPGHWDRASVDVASPGPDGRWAEGDDDISTDL
jgi:hypothetical protein